jgi:putative phage-type endonuclease
VNTLPIITAAHLHRHATRQEWRQARRLGVGASDAAGLWGASTWTSPYGVWWSKVGELDPDQPTIQQRLGHACEPFIAELFTEATGIEVCDPGEYAIYASAAWPVLCCTPDRLTVDGSAVVELKTASFQSAAQWKEAIPLGYQIQLQHQMAVMGVDLAYIAVLLNGTDYKHHTLERSDKFITQHVEKCQEFWRDNVLANEAPNTDAALATAQALAARFKIAQPVTIDLPSELEPLGEEYDALLRTNNETDKRKREITNRLKDFMGAAEQAVCGDGSGFKWRRTGTNNGTFTRVERVRDERQ